MTIRSIVEKLMPGAARRSTAFTQKEIPAQAASRAVCDAFASGASEADDLSRAMRHDKVPGASMFDLVMRAYITAPGGH